MTLERGGSGGGAGKRVTRTLLRALMGHARGETTQVYLRRLNLRRGMDSVRRLSWATFRRKLRKNCWNPTQ